MDRRIPDQETLKKKQLHGKKKEMLLLLLWNGDLLLMMRGYCGKLYPTLKK
jgi:hypothetical protein